MNCKSCNSALLEIVYGFPTPEMIEKVANINKIREENSIALVAEGKTALDPYTFDFLLLCNKICGASHYKMRFPIVVLEQKDFDAKMKAAKTFGDEIVGN